jgi:hypothetical protein
MQRFLLFFIVCSSLFAKNLEECLESCWGVDPRTTKFISAYFAGADDALVDDFINKSEAQEIDFSPDKELAILPPDDGVIAATKFHPIVFESPYVRILAGNGEMGDCEPMHSHRWPSLMVYFEPADYEITYLDGTMESLPTPPGVYELAPEQPYGCRKLDQGKEKCLRFEVKN